MSSLAIVAIPAQDDYIHKISSEKVPHVTLLFLGDDVTKVKNLDRIIDFVEHAANTTLKRFGLEVDHRGVLGPNLADVLFFSKHKWSGFETIKDYRSVLLKNDNIRTAYDTAAQYPEWTPHITLGYPATPAKPDERDYPGITYVNFDRIAVWFGDYEGVEFPLKAYNWDVVEDMAMSNSTKDIVKNVLTHYGKLGMKWGQRSSRAGDTVVSRGFGISTAGNRKRSAARASKGPQSVKITDKKKKIKTSGGKGFPAHADAVRARTIGQIGKKSGAKSLSNQDLQNYTSRINMETSFKRVQYSQKNAAARFVATILGQTGKTQAQNISNDIAAQQVKKHLGKHLLKSAAVAAV